MDGRNEAASHFLKQLLSVNVLVPRVTTNLKKKKEKKRLIACPGIVMVQIWHMNTGHNLFVSCVHVCVHMPPSCVHMPSSCL